MQIAAPTALATPQFDSLDGSGNPLPLVVRPAEAGQAQVDAHVDELESWVQAHAGKVRSKIVEHGAGDFSEGRAKVKQNGKVFTINQQGQCEVGCHNAPAGHPRAD